MIDRQELLDIITHRPGITTPELAQRLRVSVDRARWAVYQCDELEFYDGNHIRLRAQEGEENDGGRTRRGTVDD